MRITLYEYNPDWQAQFESEKRLLLNVLSGVIAEIEHIGSTAVPGLGAKPVIDILLGLRDFKQADAQISKIEKLGYEYISKHEGVMPYRRFFTKRKNSNSTHNIHMVEMGTEFWLRHLAFRNHLRNNTADKTQYHALKKELAKREWNDTNEYAAAKTEFIRATERKALNRT